jgi:hypothetical protein
LSGAPGLCRGVVARSPPDRCFQLPPRR